MAMTADDHAPTKAEVELRPPRRLGDRQSSMTEMTAELVHALNQPLSAAANYIEAAQRLLQANPQRTPQLAEALDHAASQMLRAGRMVRDLQEVISQGHPEKTLRSLHEIIRQSCERADQMIKDHEVALTLHLNADKDLVLADEAQIQQVLLSLMRKACDAMRSSKVRRLILATSLKDETLRIDVVDSRIGLSRAVDADTSDPYASSKTVSLGVGLSISRSVVEAHQGKIWAEPDDGGGARFSFTLPLAEAPAAERVWE